MKTKHLFGLVAVIAVTGFAASAQAVRIGVHLGMSGRVLVDDQEAGDPLLYASNRRVVVQIRGRPQLENLTQESLVAGRGEPAVHDEERSRRELQRHLDDRLHPEPRAVGETLAGLGAAARDQELQADGRRGRTDAGCPAR